MANNKVDTVVRETGNMFAVCLEGLRKSYRVQDWWPEYLRQCWFIAKVTSIPVTCDQGKKSLTLSSPSDFRIPVNDKRKFSYTNASPKFTWKGQFTRSGKKVTGTFSYGPNNVSGYTHCTTGGAVDWTATLQ